ncbi:subunit VI of photosystem I reaction centre [Chloropicon roscoffensis]|uniref:Subunit VI of photosystem I reaction centre n=1 Tax=Chloropicon roscoffensis TaxID=1461544 RepID=A0AAX4PKK6_9CHLO
MQGAKGVTMTRTSFVGARVTVRAPVTGRRACGGTRRTVTSAKYGEEGKYFDLNDIENTSGSWDMYGMEEGVKYPVSQEEFFKRASFGLARREALLGFIALGGGGAILTWGLKGSADAELPITKGPAPKAPPPPPPASE